MTKNGVYHFYPSAKSRRELKIKTSGVIFQGASAYYVQKSVFPLKQADWVYRFSVNFFLDDFFDWKCLPFLFQCRKMTCRGSSETCFPKVWGRTEPSLGGKRPVKVAQNFGRIFSADKFDSIVRAQGLQNWQNWPLVFWSIIQGGPDDKVTYQNQPLSSGSSLSSAVISRPASLFPDLLWTTDGTSTIRFPRRP